jgi:capsular polysaccharide biosynthesis protein
VNDPDRTVAWSNGVGNEPPKRLWAYDGFPAVEEPPEADPTGHLVSLGFIKDALRRSAWIWCTTALAGLLIGLGLYVKFPAPYQASSTVLLKENPDEDQLIAIQTDTAFAQSAPIAERVLQQLGLPQTAQAVSSLLGSYTVTAPIEQVLVFTVSAASSNDAARIANALAGQFIQFHADNAQSQLQQLLTELNQQLNQAEQQLRSVNAQISQVSAEPSSAAQQTQYNNLLQQRGNETEIEQYANGNIATAKTATYEVVNYSRVLDGAAPLSHSHKKRMIEAIGGGLIGGLALGMGIVIIQALVSDRLRRRDDVAEALGAPVRLSVRTPRGRWPMGRHGLADHDMGRVVAHLGSVVPSSFRGLASLAIVAVDNAQDVAPAVVSLAVSCARDGRQVVVADLSGGALAGLLGVKARGVHPVSVNGEHLIAVLPDYDDAAPVGPLRPHALATPASGELVAACASANLLLTLATLDAAFGGDHLVTWATDAAAVVTAARSTATRIHAVGGMIRLAGTRLDSVVLIGADKSDESLGVTSAFDQAMEG